MKIALEIIGIVVGLVVAAIVIGVATIKREKGPMPNGRGGFGTSHKGSVGG